MIAHSSTSADNSSSLKEAVAAVTRTVMASDSLQAATAAMALGHISLTKSLADLLPSSITFSAPSATQGVPEASSSSSPSAAAPPVVEGASPSSAVPAAVEGDDAVQQPGKVEQIAAADIPPPAVATATAVDFGVPSLRQLVDRVSELMAQKDVKVRSL